MIEMLALVVDTSPVDSRIEETLLIVILQLVVIMGAARFFGVVFRWMGQPQVCGEIAAGLILGPSLFGRLAPELFHRVFDPSVNQVFSILSQLGLILLMFLIGQEFDFSHLKQNGRAALSISVTGVVFPFGLGLLIAPVLYRYVGAGINLTGFSLFIATALSITAIPILGRIMIEYNISRTRLGALTITAAAIDDATGWIILALITAIVRSNLNFSVAGLMVLETAAFAAFMVLVVRPFMRRFTNWALRRGNGDLSLTSLAILLVMIFLAAAVTNKIGIFSIFGGFIMGAIIYDMHEFREAVVRRLRDFVTVFFLPIFFTFTGLRTDIGSMTGGTMWLLCGLVLLAAMGGKFGGCAVAARFSGMQWREAASVGVMMNTRALMELIVINIGYDLGVIPKSVFFMLVFMAVVTTYMTAPILRRLLVKTEAASEFLASEFARRAGIVRSHG
jgi:Kef-type K+ transport system membrane component KefB